MAEQLPSIDGLRCFVEAARLLNFRAAARAVGLTPAALGQRIRQLEELMEVKLFHRTTRSVTLTEHGSALLPHAHRALDAADACLRAGRGESGPAPIEITIGTRHELGLSWLLPSLPDLRGSQPGLTVHLYFGSGPDLVHRVRTLQIDCAVTSSVLSDAKVDFARLHEEAYQLVGAPALVEQRPLTRPDHAHEHTLIDVGPDLPLFRYLRDAEGGRDLQFGNTLCMGTIASIRQLVVAGQGIAVLPAYFVASDIAAGRLVELLPEVSPRSDFFRLVFRKDDPRRPVYERIAETLRQRPLQ